MHIAIQSTDMDAFKSADGASSLYNIIIYTLGPNNPISFGAMSTESERKMTFVFILKETK